MLKDNTVLIMAALRLFSGLVEVCAAVLIFHLNRVDTALRINGVLAVIGPTVLLTGIVVGIAGLSGRIPLLRLLLVYFGAFLIFWGTRR
ncbi:MAG: DUF2619 domain-containing protein [Clostridiales bacterium]|jgi:hypothetical protein|nr:DUF2619 domain-containing protein [Clostridiales bacterium]